MTKQELREVMDNLEEAMVSARQVQEQIASLQQQLEAAHALLVTDAASEIVERDARILELTRELELSRNHNASWSKDFDSVSKKLDAADKELASRDAALREAAELLKKWTDWFNGGPYPVNDPIVWAPLKQTAEYFAARQKDQSK